MRFLVSKVGLGADIWLLKKCSPLFPTLLNSAVFLKSALQKATSYRTFKKYGVFKISYCSCENISGGISNLKRRVRVFQRRQCGNFLTEEGVGKCKLTISHIYFTFIEILLWAKLLNCYTVLFEFCSVS